MATRLGRDGGAGLTTLRVHICDDAASASEQAAAVIGSAARAAVAARGVASLAFSGGRTPWDMLRALAEADIQWSAVHVWQTDERVAPMDDPDRTWSQLESALLSRLPYDTAKTHPMPVEAHDLRAAAARYARALGETAGTPPVLDVIHLGLGADGHTASLVPNDPVLDESQTDVAVTGLYAGRRRMTLTYPAINRARAIVWLVTGEDKADVLRRLCEGDQTIPASRVNRVPAIVLADQAAAARLDARLRG